MRIWKYLLLLLAFLLAACSVAAEKSTPVASATGPPPLAAVATSVPVATATPTAARPTSTVRAPTPSVTPVTATQRTDRCALGIGLNSDTVAIVTQYRASNGLVMAASPELAAQHFAQLPGWFRILGAPNLQTLQQKGERAEEENLPYEALAYGLETGPGTPDGEWKDPVGSARQAAAIVDAFGKQLVMGPGFQLMARHIDAYEPMAAESDIWMLQTQQLQKYPPGAEYRRAVQEIVALIRTGNPDAEIWAQITLPPDRDPQAGEWLAYHAAIDDLVTGAYIGVYTWDRAEAETLRAAVAAIFDSVCAERAGAGLQ